MLLNSVVPVNDALERNQEFQLTLVQLIFRENDEMLSLRRNGAHIC